MSDSVFSDRLRCLRTQAHLTQQAVADQLRIHRTTYTKYETGVVTPDQQGLVQLAGLFGVTVDYLLGNEDAAALVAEKNGAGMRLSLQEQQLVQLFRQLNYTEQQQLVQQVQKNFHKQKKK